MRGIPGSAEEALCYMVECELATLEWIRMIKRTSKSDIARHTSLATTGVNACKLYVQHRHAEKAGAHRLLKIMKGEREI